MPPHTQILLSCRRTCVSVVHSKQAVLFDSMQVLTLQPPVIPETIMCMLLCIAMAVYSTSCKSIGALMKLGVVVTVCNYKTSCCGQCRTNMIPARNLSIAAKLHFVYPLLHRLFLWCCCCSYQGCAAAAAVVEMPLTLNAACYTAPLDPSHVSWESEVSTLGTNWFVSLANFLPALWWLTLLCDTDSCSISSSVRPFVSGT